METPYKDKNGRVISVDDCVTITTQYDNGINYIVKFGEYEDYENYKDYSHCGFYVEVIDKEKPSPRYRYTLSDIAGICVSFTPVKVSSTLV